MFKMLSDFIVKKPWVIVALWAIILIISIPLAAGLDGRLHYDITVFIPHDMESSKANDLYVQQFPNESKSQIIVAVQSDNKTEAAQFIKALNDSIYADSTIHNVTGTTSIYDIQRTALTSLAPDLHSGLWDAYENASDASGKLYDARRDVIKGSRDLYDNIENFSRASSQMDDAYVRIKGIGNQPGVSSQLYGARDQIVSANSGLYQIKDAADLTYGIPGYYAQAWGHAKAAGLDNINASKQAKQATLQGAVNPISDSSGRALASGYLDHFDGTWTGYLASNPAAASDPASAAQHVIDLMGGQFFASAALSAQQHQVFADVLSLQLSGYGSAGTLKSYVISHAMAYQGLSSDNDKARLSAVYDLGKNPSARAVDDLALNLATAGLSDSDASQVRNIYALGRNPSDDTVKKYIIGKASEGKNESEKKTIEDAWNLRRNTGDVYEKYILDKAFEGKNESEKKTIRDIFALGKSPNDTVVDNYVLNTAYDGRNETEQQIIREVYSLGASPGENALKNYTCYKVADHLNVTGNLSFFRSLLDTDRNASDESLKSLATEWVYHHDYTNPKLFSDEVENRLVSGNITLYAVQLGDVTASLSAHDAVNSVRSDVKNVSAIYQGVKVYITGTPAISVDTETAAVQDVSSIDKISVLLILLILGVFFMSILTPFVPLAAIGVAIVTGFGLMFLSSFTTDLYYLTKTFMIVIMLGAGTDYCVFILSRYAEERNTGKGVAESVSFAIEHAGKSILCSGLTAMIGFASLMIIDNGMFRSIGQSMALAILVSMLVAMTLIPAVLMLVGDRMFWPRKIYNTGGKKGPVGGTMKAISRGVMKYPGLVVLITLLLAIPAVGLFLQMQPGHDLVSMLPNRLDSKIGFNVLEATFGSGNIDKAKIVVTLPENLKNPDGNYSVAALDHIEKISTIAASVQGIDKVYSMTRPDGQPIEYNNLSAYPEIQKTYYQTTMDNSTGIDGRTTMISVSFVGSPYSEESDQAIDTMRQKLADYTNSEGKGTSIMLGGTGAQSYDFQQKASTTFSIVVVLVFIGIFLVLTALLRSIVTPVKLFVSMLMGIMWTLAAFTLVFQYWLGTAIIWILPITLFCTLMGLGGDYVVFMMSRVREEIEKGASDENAILTAVEATGPVILLCGLVMAAAFGSMMISDMAELREFGFVLSLAIILDATVMVLVLIPSMMMVARKYNWWMPGQRNVVQVAPVQQKKE